MLKFVRALRHAGSLKAGQEAPQ